MPTAAGNKRKMEHDEETGRAKKGRAELPAEANSAGTSSRAYGKARTLPCLNCFDSLLAGRSNGVCYDSAGGGSRCARCVERDESCAPLPKEYIDAASWLYKAVKDNPKAQKTLRTVAKFFQSLQDEHEEDSDELEEDSDDHEEDSDMLSEGNTLQADSTAPAAAATVVAPAAASVPRSSLFELIGDIEYHVGRASTLLMELKARVGEERGGR
ncbi:hypothetical protein VTK56DRAFT_1277 [Thermocarpiscus australiensis]